MGALRELQGPVRLHVQMMRPVGGPVGHLATAGSKLRFGNYRMVLQSGIRSLLTYQESDQHV